MAHVSPEDRAVAPLVSKPTPLASSKTIHSLQAKNKDQSKEDPWLHDDPCKQPVPKSTRELPVGQVASIQANVEKAVLAKMKWAGDDDAMNGNQDHRIDALEQKLEMLTTQVGQQQQEQMHHNQQVQAQMQSPDLKIDQQQHSFQSVLDTKPEQQMTRIEQLFSKRPRMGEWLAEKPLRGSYLPLLWLICIFTCVCRIGEAANPGPQTSGEFTIGCLNPTGLLGRGQLIADLPKSHSATLWAVSESHLSVPGKAKFQKELVYHKAGYHLQTGATTPTRSNTATSIAGKHRGVAFLSTCPTRAMTRTWPQESWDKARFQASCLQVNQGGYKAGSFMVMLPNQKQEPPKPKLINFANTSPNACCNTATAWDSWQEIWTNQMEPCQVCKLGKRLDGSTGTWKAG